MGTDQKIWGTQSAPSINESSVGETQKVVRGVQIIKSNQKTCQGWAISLRGG